jgi:hypothetical protein
MPKIEKKESAEKEIKASSQNDYEQQEAKLLKDMEDDGFRLTGMMNPLPFFGKYYFLKDPQNPTAKEFS